VTRMISRAGVPPKEGRQMPLLQPHSGAIGAKALNRAQTKQIQNLEVLGCQSTAPRTDTIDAEIAFSL